MELLDLLTGEMGEEREPPGGHHLDQAVVNFKVILQLAFKSFDSEFYRRLLPR